MRIIGLSEVRVGVCVMAIDLPEIKNSETPENGASPDWLQMGFWLCILLAIGASSASLAWPNAGGF